MNTVLTLPVHVAQAPSNSSMETAMLALLNAGKRGLFHVTNGGACSWHEFARAIFELTGVAANLTAISSQEYGAAARRPAYSVLAPAVLTAAGLAPPRPWREALRAYLGERGERHGP